MQGALLGPAFHLAEIESFLRANQIPFTYYDDSTLFDAVTDLIGEGKVIGWFQGRMEFGPRALGARSILADPRSPEMQRRLNLKIKYRESFRPFAPAVLAESTTDYFDLDRESPYMLLVANVSANRLKSCDEDFSAGFGRLNTIRSDVPAITHIDHSARVQTVDQSTHPRFHRLLKSFYTRHGCPVVINTSFNVRGEPIVCTPQDAFTCFMNTEMDYLVLENYILAKTAQTTPAAQHQIHQSFPPD